MADDKVSLEAELRAAGFAAQGKEVTNTIKGWTKEMNAASKAGRAAKIPISELRRVAGLLGKELTGNLNPALNVSERELNEFGRAAQSAAVGVRNATGAMGASTAQANAFTRAATRGVAALGFISPTAATASAQIVGLTKASAGATLAIGAAAVGAIALGGALFKSTQAAIAFETSFIGIRKTVDGTEEDFAQLEAANRSLARSTGVSVNEINKLGQVAGQLGIPVRQLEQFERIMLELGTATDLTTNAAAFAFGGLIEVLGLTIDEVDSLSDQIVGLGNSVAATESEIVQFLNRIAGAGAILGVPAEDLVSIAAAFAALRIPAEAGGTAIQKVFLAIQKAAVAGGDELRVFSGLLNTTTAEFQRLVREDPTIVFQRFVDALSRAGPQAQLFLEKLGLNNERTRRAFLTAASAGDFLNTTIAEGSELNAEGTARTEEFARALDTTAGHISILKAEINDLAITVGDQLLPALNDTLGTLITFAQLVRDIGDAATFAKEKLDLLRFDVELPQIPGVPDVLQPLPANLDVDLSPTGLFGDVRDTLTAFGALSEGIEIIGKTTDALSDLRTTGDDGAESLLTFSDALGIIRGDADDAITGVEDLSATVTALADEAEDARDALFNMFKAPTVEEKQAELIVKNLQLAIAELGTEGTLSPELKEQKTVMEAQLKTARSRLSVVKLTSDVDKISAELQIGQLQTIREQNDAILAQFGIVRNLNNELGTTANIQDPITLTVDTNEITRILGTLDEDFIGPLTQEDHDVIIALAGDEAVTAALQEIIDLGNTIDGNTFEFTVTESGADALIRALQTIISLTNSAITAQGILFDIAALNAQLPDPNTLFKTPDQIIAEQRLRDLVSLGGGDDLPGDFGSGAAAKVIDPLKDGIITLAEALEFGFTAASAATAELQFETQKLAARYFRVAVESIKLERAERRRQHEIEVGLRLAEREIEFRKELVELQIEEAVAMAELKALLEGTGLEANIDTFAFAVRELGEEIIIAGESTAEAMQRLSQAAVDAVQTQFDALFNRPTREDAQLGAQLALLELDRALLVRSGASDELLQAKDDEIRQIQNLIDVRRAEAEVAKANNLLADQTLLTQHEQGVQALTLTGLLAEETELLRDLNNQVALEALLLGDANQGILDFTSAIRIASEVISANTLGPGPGQSPGFLAGQTQQLNVEAHFTINADTSEEIKKQFNEDLEDALNVAGLSGTNAGTGTFIP